MTITRPPPSVLIIIPCLNEAAYVRGLLDTLRPSAERLSARIVVVDGGSVDGTQAIVARYAMHSPRVVLIHNAKRIQSAAINLAVRKFGQGFDYLIRIDAHGKYPPDYCDRLVEEAVITGADSVVVSMVTEGRGVLQSAAAAVQNSKLGTGGSHHRRIHEGRWIDHGHHALMRVSAFRAVGGYDETFRQNEDAELDFRLAKGGYLLWLTDRTRMTYFPRSTLGKLYLQYLGYGRGRARNLTKHRMLPKLRQAIPLLVFPSAVTGLGALALMTASGSSRLGLLALLPAALWLSACGAFGVRQAVRARDPRMAVVSVSAAVMHFAWSLGFWLQLTGIGPGTGSAAR